jgi:tetratricopeptide (TPR) repeat protein
MSASEKAAWLMAQAARAYGSQTLAAPGGAGRTGPAELGRDLARLIFGGGPGDPAMPALFSALIARPDSPEALTAVDTRIEEVLAQDAELAATVDGMLAGFFTEQLQSGDGQALADAGSLLWWEEPQKARDAFERAIDLGNEHARIDLAQLHEAVLHDRPAALRLYQQAAASTDPDVAAESLVKLGQTQAIHRELPAAQTTYHQAISTRHPHWAPQAMIGLGTMLHREGDDNAAQDLYRQAIDAGDTHTRAQALLGLASLLKRHGDIPGAKAAWRQVIGSREAPWAEIAFSHLLNQLSDEDDLDGARDMHRLGVETANPDTPHALVTIGNLLKERGDTEGWRAAYQQAIDSGYDAAGDLREILSPSADDQDEPAEDPYPADLPPQFDPANMRQTGIAVLHHGLPPLPATLTYQMAIPVAYWTARHCAVVLFLQFTWHRREQWPVTVMATFSQDQDRWEPDSYWVGTGGHHDPIANPGDLREMDGQAMTTSGGSHNDTPAPGHPAAIQIGRAASAVTQIVLTQNGHEDRRPLDTHFGFWVICTEQPSPFQVTGLDKDGTVLAQIND